MQVLLVDGTYELFRHFFAVPPRKSADGMDVGAVAGVVGSMMMLIQRGATHLGVATDHVIESFRNEMWPGYKKGEGVAPELLAQFPVLEEALEALGVAVWPMKEYEADDGLATAARQAALYAESVVIGTPDKDLAQCVVGDHVTQFDRRLHKVFNEAGVIEKFGVPPKSIPDYLALVGDSSDGFPGLPGWGPKSAAAVLSVFGTVEAIPDDWTKWGVTVRGAPALAATLQAQREFAMLFKDLATLRFDAPIDASEEALRWRGPRPEFRPLMERFGVPGLAGQAHAAWEVRKRGNAGNRVLPSGDQ